MRYKYRGGHRGGRVIKKTPVTPEKPANKSISGNDDYRFSAESHPVPAEPSTPEPQHHGKNQLYELSANLSDRDFAILSTLRDAKYLLTDQIRRLHFYNHASKHTATRKNMKTLHRLEDHGLIKTFKRRIGGANKGSASYVWFLTEAGQRLLNLRDNIDEPRRSHRYLEPSYVHVRHTLAVAECYVQLIEISRKYKHLSLANVQWEPECWRPYTKDGYDQQLKPDFFAVTKNGEYEDRWFIEIDLNTEALPVVLEKCKRYHYYLRTGIEQKKHQVFPVTVWVAPDESRKQKLIEGIDKTFKNGPKMFAVITDLEFEDLIKHGATDGLH